MNTKSTQVSAIAQRVMESLQSDLVSTGELKQIISDVVPHETVWRDLIAEVIRHLLAEGVEIGDARDTSGTYVTFTAWRGTISARCERAIKQMESVDKIDPFCAFWLCLRSNVDRYETT